MGGIAWIGLAHDRDGSEVLVNAVMNLWVSFSGRILLSEVSFLPVQDILLRSVRINLSGSCVSVCQSGLDTFFCNVRRKF